MLPGVTTKFLGTEAVVRGVPFNYLVPDERMLPAESIRFFQLDESWMDCLLDGAFSIGRVTTAAAHNAIAVRAGGEAVSPPDASGPG